MTTIDSPGSASDVNQDAVDESWSAFVARLTRFHACDLASIDRATPIKTVVASTEDRIGKALLMAALRAELGDCPDELFEAVNTFGDAYDWRAQRHEARGSPLTSHHEGAPEPSNPGSSSSRVSLRPITPEDLVLLYQSALDPRWSYRWRYRGHTPSYGEFVNSVQEGALAQFVVMANRSTSPVGLVSAYGARHDQGHCYVAFSRVQSTTSSGAEMMEGGFHFLNFVFRTWGFRKLYAEVPGFNWPQFESGASTFFHVEGVLRDHSFFDGRYWDEYLIAIYRDEWTTLSSTELGALYAV